MKRCSKCHEVKDVSEFRKDRASKDGLQGYCKPCHSASVRNAPSQTAEARRARGAKRTDAEADRVRALQRARYARWKAKQVEADPDALRRYEADKVARWRERNPEKAKASKAKWNEANPGKINEHSNRRRAQKVGPVNYREIVERDGGICYLCGTPVDMTLRRHPMAPHFDHVIPLSKGGPHSMDNIRLTHARCNYRKAARLHESDGNA